MYRKGKNFGTIDMDICLQAPTCTTADIAANCRAISDTSLLKGPIAPGSIMSDTASYGTSHSLSTASSTHSSPTDMGHDCLNINEMEDDFINSDSSFEIDLPVRFKSLAALRQALLNPKKTPLSPKLCQSSSSAFQAPTPLLRSNSDDVRGKMEEDIPLKDDDLDQTLAEVLHLECISALSKGNTLLSKPKAAHRKAVSFSSDLEQQTIISIPASLRKSSSAPLSIQSDDVPPPVIKVPTPLRSSSLRSSDQAESSASPEEEAAIVKMRDHLNNLFEELKGMQFTPDKGLQGNASSHDGRIKTSCFFGADQPGKRPPQKSGKGSLAIQKACTDVCTALASLPLLEDEKASRSGSPSSNCGVIPQCLFQSLSSIFSDTHSMIKASVRILLDPNSAVSDKCQIVEFIAFKSKEDSRLFRTLRQQRVYEILVNLLAHDHVIVRETASKAIWYLCSDPVSCVEIKATGAVLPLCALLSTNSEKIQRNVAGALAFLCMNEYTRQLCSDSHVIISLLRMLQSLNTDVQENAVCALSVLTQAARAKTICRDYGGIDALVHMQFSCSSKAKEYALETLRHLNGGDVPEDQSVDSMLSLPSISSFR
mmetsp:Transcript_10441/g.17077  ORF Transcript_10441/g.17077 Transcript_10441/m.17077 type:complete len:597 (+) Transcript_10441:404-2194(+)